MYCREHMIVSIDISSLVVHNMQNFVTGPRRFYRNALQLKADSNRI